MPAMYKGEPVFGVLGGGSGVVCWKTGISSGVSGKTEGEGPQRMGFPVVSVKGRFSGTEEPEIVKAG